MSLNDVVVSTSKEMSLPVKYQDELLHRLLGPSAKTIEGRRQKDIKFPLEHVNKIIPMYLRIFKSFECSTSKYSNSREALRVFFNEANGRDRQCGTFTDLESIFNESITEYSNLPSHFENQVFIRDDYVSLLIEKSGKNKVLNIQGIMGIGKSSLAAAFAKDRIRDYPSEFRAIVWLEDMYGSLTLTSLLTAVLSLFCADSITNLPLEEMKAAACKKLREIKTIIVLDNFETVRKESYGDLLDFIFGSHGDTIFVLVSGTQLTGFKELSKSYNCSYTEVKLEKISHDEWLKVIARLRKMDYEINNTLVNTSRERPSLGEYIYDFCEGIPYAMTLLLSSFSNMIQNGISFETVIEEYKNGLTDDTTRGVFERAINSLTLTDDMEKLLSCLSLFAVPATAAELSKISGLPDVDAKGSMRINSRLYKAISDCREQFLIEAIKIETPRYYMPSIIRRLYGFTNADSELIGRYVDYYKAYSQNIGYCYNHYEKLEALDLANGYKEADNISALLEYCYSKGDWQNYYDISDAVKYYYYTRGESGNGINSINYRRAVSAERLNDIEGQYAALLYHCNVSCKTRSLEGLEACFDALSALRVNESIKEINRIKLDYTKGLYSFAKGEYEEALKWYTQYLAENQKLCDDHEDFANQLKHDYVACLRWKSECCYMLAKSAFGRNGGKNVCLDDALLDLDESIEVSKEIKFLRSVIHALLLKAKILILKGQKSDTLAGILDELRANKENFIDKDFLYKKEYEELLAGYERLQA